MWGDYMNNRIRELRKKKGITMKQLGEIVDLAESTISQYETGKREPDNETLLKISEYFGVTVGYLLGAEEAIKEAPTPKDERNIDDAKAAFFDGYGENLTEEEKDELWEDARIYAKFKAQQKK